MKRFGVALVKNILRSVRRKDSFVRVGLNVCFVFLSFFKNYFEAVLGWAQMQKNHL